MLRGRALMLRDAPSAPDAGKETPPRGFDARMLIAAVPGGPSEADQRADFARLMFNEIERYPSVSRITMSEPLRIGGQSGFQTMAEAQAMCAAAPTCASSNGCVLAAVVICKWSASAAPTAGPTCSRACARCATASNRK